MREYKTGILGASGWLAKELLQWLDKWHFPCTLVLFDDREYCGQIITFAKHSLPIHAWENQAIAMCDILFDCRSTRSFLVQEICKEQAYIIDLSNCEAQGKWIVPNDNLNDFTKSDTYGIIPNALFLLLANLYSVIRTKTNVKKIYLTSLHSVAQYGNEGCQDLMNQLAAYQKGQEIESKLFPIKDAYQHLPLLFQALPQTDAFYKNGDSKEEALLKKQLKQCFCDDVEISATCVRIAALRGLSMNVAFTCEKHLDNDVFVDAFSAHPAMICYDDISHNMYPICADVIHDHRIYIGRMRKSDAETFTAWAVCDDLAIRCSAAVKLAYFILHNYL